MLRVEEFLPWYSSVHRGAGHASQVSTRLYEASRLAVHRFVGARPGDVVVLVRNTTDAVNHLAATLPIRDPETEPPELRGLAPERLVDPRLRDQPRAGSYTVPSARAFPHVRRKRRRTGIEPAWELSPPHRF